MKKLLILLLTSILTAQTYTVGDVVDNFGTSICANDSGNWEYDTDGLHNITWIIMLSSSLADEIYRIFSLFT